MAVMRIVSVRTGNEVSRAVLGAGDKVTYAGGDTAQAVVRDYRSSHESASEADAVRALLREGWSNGYLMVELT